MARESESGNGCADSDTGIQILFELMPVAIAPLEPALRTVVQGDVRTTTEETSKR